MKLIPVFLIIFLFSTSLILAYLTWTTILTSQNDKYLSSNNNNEDNDKTGSSSSSSDNGNNDNGDGTGDESTKNSISILQNLIPFFRRAETSKNGISNLGTVDEKSLLGEDLLRNVERIRMKVISNLRRYLLNGAKVNGHVNAYSVNFTQYKQKLLKKPNRQEMMCRIKSLLIDILDESTNNVFRDKPFPERSLFDEYKSNQKTTAAIKERGKIHKSSSAPSKAKGESKSINLTSSYHSTARYKRKVKDFDEPIYRSCAVVPNSAALDGSEHGIDIDSHDFILRFNNAPTEGYEEDVGTLTSMRIVNSQVVTKSHFFFPHSTYFDDKPEKKAEGELLKTPQEIGALNALWMATKKYLMWDPCNYTSTVEQWYASPEFPLFEKYFNLTKSQANPFYGRNRFYILNCRSIWKMWDLLQEYSIARIYGTPPTSGFIGILLMLQVCERVNVYEYIPSIKESVRCNYYGPKNDSNPSCTYGSWHPVSAEKLFALELSDSTDKQIFMDGLLSIPGVSAYKCT